MGSSPTWDGFFFFNFSCFWGFKGIDCIMVLGLFFEIINSGLLEFDLAVLSRFTSF